MFERGHSKHLSESKVTYREGYSQKRGAGAGPPAPPESVLYNEALPFYGREFSDILLRGYTQKQGLLKCAVWFPAVVAYLNTLPLRSVPWWGLTVLSAGCGMWHLRSPSLMAGTVLPLGIRKVKVAWGPLRSENQFWKDDSHGLIVKPLGHLSK